MCAWIVPPIGGLSEPAIAPEIVADGIGAVEFHHGQVRIYLYAEQMPLDGDEAAEPGKIVTAKIVGQAANIPAAIAQLARCLITGRPAPGIVPDPAPSPPKTPRLVR